MRLLYDSTTPQRSIPSGAQMILAYIDGRITSGNYAAAKASHPNALMVSCTTIGTAGVKVGDCESGDMDIPTLVHWMVDEVHAGRHPTGYCNSSTWPQVEAAVAMVGLRPIRDISYGIAQYDNNPAIPADWQARGCVFKQYRSDTAANLDYSVVADYWPGVDQPTEESIVATDTDRGGLVRLTYLSTFGREPSAQEWGIGKIALAQNPDLDHFVASVADSPGGQAALRARNPQG